MSSHSQLINRSFSVKEMVTTALMSAILFCAQIAMAVIPNIEVVSLLIILYTVCFSPRQALIATYIFCMLEGLVFGFGIWFFTYLYVWPILVLVAWFMKKNSSVILWAVVSGAFGLSFGALCSIPYIFTGGIYAGFTWWISGIPFDIAHCFGNVIVILVLYKPMSAFFNLVNRKMSYR